MDLPIKHGGSFHSYVSVYQAGYSDHMVVFPLFVSFGLIRMVDIFFRGAKSQVVSQIWWVKKKYSTEDLGTRPGKLSRNYGKNITIFFMGKYQLFQWSIFNSKLLVYQRKNHRHHWGWSMFFWWLNSCVAITPLFWMQVILPSTLLWRRGHLSPHHAQRPSARSSWAPWSQCAAARRGAKSMRNPKEIGVENGGCSIAVLA